MMKPIYRSTLLLLAVYSSGCAADLTGFGPGTDKPEQPCAGNGNSRNCWIEVTVEEQAGGRVCRVAIAAEQQEVGFQRSDGVRIITWKLAEAPDDYQFRSDGIFIKEGPGEEESDLDLFTWAEQGRQYRVRNLNRSEGTYRYGVGVVNQVTGVQCDLDPYIRNLR